MLLVQTCLIQRWVVTKERSCLLGGESEPPMEHAPGELGPLVQHSVGTWLDCWIPSLDNEKYRPISEVLWVQRGLNEQ